MGLQGLSLHVARLSRSHRSLVAKACTVLISQTCRSAHASCSLGTRCRATIYSNSRAYKLLNMHCEGIGNLTRLTPHFQLALIIRQHPPKSRTGCLLKYTNAPLLLAAYGHPCALLAGWPLIVRSHTKKLKILSWGSPAPSGTLEGGRIA